MKYTVTTIYSEQKLVKTTTNINLRRECLWYSGWSLSIMEQGAETVRKLVCLDGIAPGNSNLK
jgi:hypothetical protein